MRFFSNTRFLPAEVLKPVSRIILYGRSEILLEQHRGLYSYSPSCVRIKTSQGLVSAEGKELTIHHFGVEDILIQGEIFRITMEENS